MKPLCFVLMPFGIKTDGSQNEINFDIVYNTFIKISIIEAGLEPIRADEEKGGGFIHKPMYERLMFCNFAVADLSYANANVFYELGIRHAIKRFTTVSIFEINTKLPFDVAALRAFPYEFKNGAVLNIENKIKDLSDKIKINLNSPEENTDSPIAEMILQYKFPDLQSLQIQSDSFKDWARKTKSSKEELEDLADQWKIFENEKSKPNVTDEKKEELSASQKKLIEQVNQIEESAKDELNYNYDLMYALLNTYKSMNAFREITDLLKPVKANIYLKQQLALAFNKTKEREKAETILKAIIKQFGPDPETNGLLGAVYKGMMDDIEEDELLADQYCINAVDAYLSGFEADPRYFYPGINALTLMFLSDRSDERFGKFIPLVRYAIERQLVTKTSDYWTQASALELAALELKETEVKKFLAAALTCKSDKWMKDTTAGNLKKIYAKAIKNRNQDELKWLADAIIRLE